MAMDVSRESEETPTVPQLQDLFANPQLLFDSDAGVDYSQMWINSRRIEKMEWDPSGRLLALAAYNREAPSISIADSSNGSSHTIPIDNLSHHTIPQLAWNKSGTLLALGLLERVSRRSKIAIYDVAKRSISRKFNTLDGQDYSPVIAWSPHEETMLAVLESPNLPVRFYRIPENNAEPVTHTDPPVAFNSQGYYGEPTQLNWKHKHNITMAYVRAAFCMNTETQKLGTIMSGGPTGTGPCPQIACHPQKNIVAAGRIPEWQGGFLSKPTAEDYRFWRLALYQIDEAPQPTMLATTQLDGWEKNTHIRSLAFSHDGQFLIAARDDGFSIMNGETLQELLFQRHTDKTKQYLAQWNPKTNQLAFTRGTQLYITDDLKNMNNE